MSVKGVIAAVVGAMATLGFLVGMLVGLSESSVVGSLLPLLFALLGGAGGFFVLKVDFSAEGPRRSLLVYALTLIGICLGTCSGVLVGMEMRLGKRLGFRMSAGASPMVGLTGAEVVEHLMLDARLNVLGLAPEASARVVDYLAARTRRFALDAAELEAIIRAIRAALPGEGSALRETWLDAIQKLDTIVANARPERQLDGEAANQARAIAEQAHNMLRIGNVEDAFWVGNVSAAAAVRALDAWCLRERIRAASSEDPVWAANQKLREFMKEFTSVDNASFADYFLANNAPFSLTFGR